MRFPTLLATLLAASLLLTACGRSPEQDSRENDPLLLRQYATPPDRSDAVALALNDVLASTETETGVGRASARVAGQVVVLAPASMQTSIAKTIESLVGDEVVSTTASKSLRVHYWFVEALPGEGTDGPGLADIGATLKSLQPSLGVSHFRLVDRVSLVSGSQFGRSDTRSGRGTIVEQNLQTDRDGLRAAIQIREPANSGALDVQLHLKLDETVLLSMVNANDGDDAAQRLVLLRAEAIGTP